MLDPRVSEKAVLVSQDSDTDDAPCYATAFEKPLQRKRAYEAPRPKESATRSTVDGDSDLFRLSNLFGGQWQRGNVRFANDQPSDRSQPQAKLRAEQGELRSRGA